MRKIEKRTKYREKQRMKGTEREEERERVRGKKNIYREKEKQNMETKRNIKWDDHLERKVPQYKNHKLRERKVKTLTRN